MICVRVIGCSLAFWACVLLNQSLAAQQAVIHPANAGRNLRASGQHIFEEDELGSLSPSVAGGESDLFEGVWPMLAIAVFFELFYLTDAILRPFDTLILVKIYLTEQDGKASVGKMAGWLATKARPPRDLP